MCQFGQISALQYFFITPDWAVSTLSDSYVTFFLTNCVFPTQIWENTCICLIKSMRELYRKVSKSTISLIFFLHKTQNNRNVTVQQIRYIMF